MRPTHAIVRGIPATFQQAVVMAPHAEPIDVEHARRQHEAYVRALAGAGLAIIALPALDGFPDCCFVEDCALVAEGVALILRPGAASRQGEQPAVREALGQFLRLEAMEAPATADGGDCMRVGRTIYVGQSARTNADGIIRIREVFEPLGFRIMPVPVGDALHLKCVCSPLGETAILLAEGTIPPATFSDLRIVRALPAEAYAANVVTIGKGVIMASGHPTTEALVRSEGFDVVALEMSEIRKADGSLTCLSILV